MLICFLLFSSNSLAADKSVASAPEAPQPEPSDKYPNGDQRGSEKVPFFIRGEITTQVTSAEAEKEARESKVKIEIDRSNSIVNRWVALFAFFGVLVAIFQAVLFFRQLRFMGKEFISANRPRIVVRHVSLDQGHGGQLPAIFGAKFIIANAGNSTAKITGISAHLWYAVRKNETLPIVPPYSEIEPAAITLAAGESVAHHHQESVEYSPDEQFQHAYLRVMMRRTGAKGTTRFYLLGYIVYEDGNKVKHRTAFLREYDDSVGRFETIVHPDYEYQD